MPELLLSSLSAKEPIANKSKASDNASISVERSDKPSKFTNTLSSVVKQSSTDKKPSKEDDSLAKVSSSLKDLSEELSKIELESDELADVKDFLNGHDLSTKGLIEEKLGLSLPEFLKQLQEKMNALNEFMNTQEGVSIEDLSGLEYALTQLSQTLAAISTKQGDAQADITPALVGFSFNSGSGRGGSNWQQYDPQQMSQNGQSLTGEPLGFQFNNGLLSEQLVSKTDRAFQLQMEQLIAEKSVDVNDKTSLFDAATIETKDKAISQFSDLQLRPTGESLKPYSTTLGTPVSAQNWSDELSQKIVWFSGRNISAAEMHLNPAELGPIDVKINVQNDVASITFNVSNSSVKDLLESSVIRLREMMEANGVSLGEVNIDADSREQPPQDGSDNARQGFAGSINEASELAEDATEQTITLKQTNLVDYFV